MRHAAVTAQPSLFEAEPFDPLAWLAPRLLDAHDLLMVHHGDLEGARSQITATVRGEFTDDGEHHQVQGRRVTYGHAGHAGHGGAASRRGLPRSGGGWTSHGRVRAVCGCGCGPSWCPAR